MTTRVVGAGGPATEDRVRHPGCERSRAGRALGPGGRSRTEAGADPAQQKGRGVRAVPRPPCGTTWARTCWPLSPSHRMGTARRLPPPILRGGGALVPGGLQRAQRRLGPRRRCSTGRCSTVTKGAPRARRYLCGARVPLAFRDRALTIRVGSPRRVSFCSWRWSSPVPRYGRSCRSPAVASSTQVFFDGARTSADLVVGEVGEGWRVAMVLLGFERGVSTLAHRSASSVSLTTSSRSPVSVASIRSARASAARRRVDSVAAHAMEREREHSACGVPGSASISKLFWGTWHRELGNLGLDLLGEGIILVRRSRTS